MPRLAIAMDIGTSGLRAQAVDLLSREIISTAITTHHPLPGSNVIDHLHFAIEMGVETASEIIIQAVNKVIGKLHINSADVVRLAFCGNPVQLSLLQGMEIRDLAYAGQKKLKNLGVVSPKREAVITTARDMPLLYLPAGCEIIIPPSVCHEVGADALALIIQTGMLDKDETSLATDFGTNAEMALFHKGEMFTGSAAAGPALEGQHITSGMLASPGAICDLETDNSNNRLVILDSEMLPVKSSLINVKDGSIIDAVTDVRPTGITGTGIIALIYLAMEDGLISLPHITTNDENLHLSEGISFTNVELAEAGKAIGAIRTGHFTLCREADIDPKDIQTTYMAGASGTYVDAIKAWKLGMVPPQVKDIYQVGNTSLAMARDLVFDTNKLEMMGKLANQLRQHHCMFASSEIFKKIYILELSFWTEGMPLSMYRKFLKSYGFLDLSQQDTLPEVIHTVKRDIDDMGHAGLTIIPDIGNKVRVNVEGCTACMDCVEECPENALTLINETGKTIIELDQSLCSGVACRRCEKICPENCFNLINFFCK